MNLGDLFSNVFTVQTILLMVLGVVVGIIGGALPGISSTMTVALVATICYSMDTISAVMFLAATQVGSTYGGSITASVLNIPGTPASAATAMEGYPMSKRGEAQKALAVNAMGSFVGNTIGVFLLLAVMPLVLMAAMAFGPWEMFWFAMFGLFICVKLSRGDFTRGLLSACLGLVLAFVGKDPIMGTVRFTYGIPYLRDGVNIIPAMVGLYGMSEVFTSLVDHGVKPVEVKHTRAFAVRELWEHRWMALRVAVIGFVIGVIPGVGSNIASWVGYDHAMSSSRHPEQFGHGSIEGLIGSETANNACVPGTFAPLLALGVPGDAVTAIVLGILTVHGVQPGPTFLAKNPNYLYMIGLAMLISGVLFLFIGTFVGKAIIKLLVIPLPGIMAAVACLCAIGAFSASNRYQDIVLMFCFGLLGIVMNKNRFPIGPLILGLVVGGNLADANFRRALLAAKGSFLPFITRPVSAVMVALLLVMVFRQFCWPQLQRARAQKSKNKN